jgi:hypothetical protein
VQIVAAAREDDRKQRRMRVHHRGEKAADPEADVFAARALVDEVRWVFGLMGRVGVHTR